MVAARNKLTRSKSPTSAKAAAARADVQPGEKPSTVEGTQTAPKFDLTDLLAQSSWHTADQSLAQALRDFGSLERVAQSLGRKLRSGEHATHAERMEGALLTVTQSLRSAGRRRNLHRFAEPGAVEDFNEELHELDSPGRSLPGKVRIVAQGICRGLGPETEILLKARVAPVRMRAGRKASGDGG